MIDPCRSDDMDLCTESVSYTRTRTLSGSGEGPCRAVSRSWIEIAHLGLEFLVAFAVLGVTHHLPNGRRRAHTRAPAQERRETGKAEPCLIPEEADIRLDREALQHCLFDVGDVPSKVQLVRTMSFARSSFPSAFSCNSAFLSGLIARLPYMEYWVTGRRQYRAVGRLPARVRSGATCDSRGRSARYRRARVTPGARSCWT